MAGGDDGLEDRDDPLAVGSYSQLLFADEVADDLDPDGCFNFTTPSFSSTPPKMLCFGDDNSQDYDFAFEKITANFAKKSGGVTCSDSSSASSTTVNSNITTTISKTNVSSSQKSNKKRNVSGTIGAVSDEPVQNSAVDNVAPAGSQRNCKKKKSADNLIETATGHAKVRQPPKEDLHVEDVKKEKLGERVIALQQLVSPFGKTDTASVLHEAMGYIRFLQDQVQVLCSPYLQRLPSSPHYLLGKGGECKEGRSMKDLRSKGLCLVPVELTLHVAETNGADFWSPAMVNK